MNISVAHNETTGRLLDCPSTAHVVCRVPFGGVLRLAGGEWWVEVTPPAGTPAGDYLGCLEIDGVRVDVNVHVWPFRISRSIPIYAGLNPDRVAAIEGGDRNKYDSYVGLLALHGVDRGMVLPPLPYDKVSGAARPSMDYLRSLPKRPLYLLSCPYGLDDLPRLRMYLHMAGVAWRQCRTERLGVYLVDEPSSRDEAGRKRQQDARAVDELLRSIDSPIVSVIPGSAADLAEVPVGLPVYLWSRDYPADGSTAHWVYTALDNRGVAPTWLATSPPADFVAAFAAAFCTGAQGIWYWTAVLDEPYKIGDREFAGEGQWIKQGPTPTKQLKLVNEGSWLHAYLNAIPDRDQAKRLAAVIAPSFRVWERDLGAIYRVKDECGYRAAGTGIRYSVPGTRTPNPGRAV